VQGGAMGAQGEPEGAREGPKGGAQGRPREPKGSQHGLATSGRSSGEERGRST